MDTDARPLLSPGLTVLVILMLAFVFGRPFALPETQWDFWDAARGIFLVSTSGIVALLISRALFPGSRLTVERNIYPFSWESVLLFVVLLGPLWEELVFRYVLIGAMSKWSPTMAILFSGVLFGVVHARYKFAKIVKGLGYGWLYVMSGTIWAPFVAHALWNFGCVVLLREQRERSLYEGSLGHHVSSGANLSPRSSGIP